MLNISSNYPSKAQNRYNQSFCSLHMNVKEIERNVSPFIANEAAKAEPALEKIAKDVEVFVSPIRYKQSSSSFYKLLKIDVQPKNAPEGLFNQEQTYPMRGNSCEAMIEEVQSQKDNLVNKIKENLSGILALNK